jgi:hypothetical protein
VSAPEATGAGCNRAWRACGRRVTQRMATRIAYFGCISHRRTFSRPVRERGEAPGRYVGV